MAYANIDLDLFEHRKTKRLVAHLGAGAEIYLIRLWVYCGKFHAEDGRLDGYSDQEIEGLLGWTGDAGKMLQAMLAACFVHRDGDTVVVHDWLEHQGHIARFKQRGKDMAERRWGKKVPPNATESHGTNRSNATGNATSITNSNATGNAPQDATSNAPTVLTVLTEREYTRTHQHDGGGGGEADFAHIPTVDEVRALALIRGIPASYAAHYHETCEIKRRWVTRAGNLIDWRREIVSWWTRDRSTWNEKPGDGRPLDEIEAELRQLKDQPDTPENYARKSALLDEVIAAKGRKG